jgi:hypothetical protein
MAVAGQLYLQLLHTNTSSYYGQCISIVMRAWYLKSDRKEYDEKRVTVKLK